MFVHHGDKDAFLKGNKEPDPDELDIVFDSSPSYAELLQQVRKILNWMDPTDIVELEGVGECSIFKNFLRTRKIMVMHSNERGE